MEKRRIDEKGLRALLVAAGALFCVPILVGGLMFAGFTQNMLFAPDAGGEQQSARPLAKMYAIHADIALAASAEEEEEAADAWDPGVPVSLPAAKEAAEGFGGYVPSAAASKSLQECIDKVRKDGVSAGFVLLDLTTGQGVAYNTEKVFYGASSIKFHRLVAIVLKHPEMLKDYQRMVTNVLWYSDNDAYAFLCQQYADVPFDAYAKEAGAKMQFRKSGRYASYDTGSLVNLWLSAYALIQTDKNCSKLAGIAGDPEVSAIHDVLGEKYETVSKAGWYDGQDNASTVDGGIVYAGQSPYLLVIMSDYPGVMEKLYPLVRALEKAHQEIIAEGQ